jgi:putative transposase
MPRIARVVVPGIPHHVVQRGNRSQKSFFSDADRSLYLRLLKRHGERAGLSFLAYCLMENHVHLIAVPKNMKSLWRGLGEAHRKYTTIINIREDWRGYLWQGRFSSFPLDEGHFYRAVRYIERNPVRAGIVSRAEDYPWSSARAHVLDQSDPLLASIRPFLKLEDWISYLRDPDDEPFLDQIRGCSRTGRPLGEESFLIQLEKSTGRRLRARDYSAKCNVKRDRVLCPPIQ